MQPILQGKTILVAGSSRGLGYAVAHASAAEGANVFMGSRDVEKLAHSASQIVKNTGSNVLYSPLDVSRYDSIKRWVDAALQQFGRIDGLLVNAGGPPAGTLESLTDQQWQSAYELTLLSAVRLIRECLSVMKKSSGGSIVTITSVSVKEPIDMLLLSNVFRSGVTSLVKTLSRDLASYSIRINNILPGRFDTERVEQLDRIIAESKGIGISEVRSSFFEQIPLSRYGKPEELGNLAAFLFSEKASFITGVTIPVDGGMTKTVW
ncbi:MAG TPA: SDR family oxidoreductase [Tenuifilaceae bacterium]|jgi:3-oxoacyl-[acyl-carrier protein] reductase|nr:SDR family oxidoreductase [Bacteroidales bacterium]MDI9516137.1 SDR family oxidoreductase [Bacteroidota bacterium]NLH57765.1 SDR family oxidoreductase [Rikenellaceae bacterium]OQC61258.1 MAG: Glucose 1-dehydrogenase 2 [Bacteroidetes bacterium ADurb.Bin008]HNV81767.1 SDR family oxidoreductase [Tenuifilaceae bacterium]